MPDTYNGYTENQLVQFYKQTGWTDEAAIRGDIRAGHWQEKVRAAGGGATGGSEVKYPSVEDYIKAVTELLPKPKEDYETVHPFSFDETLARLASEAEYTPYYSELLGDYLKQVQTTRERALTDKTRALTELEAAKESYMKTEGINWQKLLKDTEQGFATRGLWWSGEREKGVGEKTELRGTALENYLRGVGYQRTGLETTATRTLEDLAREEAQRKRDVVRQQEEAITGGVQQRKREVLEEYEIGRQKYYEAPNWGILI